MTDFGASANVTDGNAVGPRTKLCPAWAACYQPRTTCRLVQLLQPALNAGRPAAGLLELPDGGVAEMPHAAGFPFDGGGEPGRRAGAAALAARDLLDPHDPQATLIRRFRWPPPSSWAGR